MSLTFILVASYFIIGMIVTLYFADIMATAIDNNYKKVPNKPHVQEGLDGMKKVAEGFNTNVSLILSIVVVLLPFIWLPLFITSVFAQSS